MLVFGEDASELVVSMPYSSKQADRHGNIGAWLFV